MTSAPSSPASGDMSPSRGRTVRAVAAAIRPAQWVKNVLLFVPAVTAHRITDGEAVRHSVLAFAAFCCVASMGYVVNDVLDREHDRRHPLKRTRPFASGTLSPAWAPLLIALLLLAALALARAVPSPFWGWLAAYAALTAAYSVRIKRLLFLDVLALAALYTVRIIAGTAAIAVTLSPWLLAFSMFLFFSLALMKRTSELDSLRGRAPEAAAGRAYEFDDASTLVALGAASACTAVLVLALYVSAPEVSALYSHPVFLWGLSPLFLYWLGRLWIVARRGYLEGDPLLYAARDRASYAVGLAALLIVWLAL